MRRLNVVFSGDAHTTLRELAAAKGKTISAVLREAVALAKWTDEHQRDGWRFIREDADGRRTEVVFL